MSEKEKRPCMYSYVRVSKSEPEAIVTLETQEKECLQLAESLGYRIDPLRAFGEISEK